MSIPMAAKTSERLWLTIPLLFAAGMSIALLPYLVGNNFYYQDDMQYQFLPIFYHIGRLLRAGEFPYLTLSSWFGGNIAAEWQFAIYNPISLALYAILPSFKSYLVAGVFLACFYYGVITAGCYALARTYRIDRRWAALTALCLATSNFLSYWAASNWFPNFSTCAWLVWSWAFMRMAPKSRAGFVGAVAFSYLTISSGFPHTIIMLGLVCLLTMYEHWSVSGWKTALAAPSAIFLAILLAALSLLAVVGVSGVGTRQNQIYNGDFLTPDLRDLLQISSASHFGFMNIYGGFGRVQVPIFYVAWFIVPLLPLLNWRLVDWRAPKLTGLLVFIGFLVFVFGGPEDFFIIRYFFRWMPYLHLAVLLSFFLLVQQMGITVTRTTVLLSVAALAVTTLASLQVTPERYMVHLASAGLALAGLVLFLICRSRERLAASVLAFVVLALFSGTHILLTRHGNFIELNSPRETSGLVDNLTTAAPESYSISLGTQDSDGKVERKERFSNGYTFLESGLSMINGYSGIGHRALEPFLCLRWAGQTCPESATRLGGIEPETGVPYLDLFRVDEITAQKGEHLDLLVSQLDASWTLAQDGQYGQRFARNLPASPGTLAWTSDVVTVDELTRPTIRGETLNVKNSSNQKQALVFSRLWWPGYRANLNGVGIEVRATAGIFVTVDIPPSTNGTLNLFFSPPRQTTGFILTMIGALLTALGTFFHAKLFQKATLAPSSI